MLFLKVISVDKSKRDKSSKEFKFPEQCLCGSTTQKKLINQQKVDAVEDA